MISVVIDTNVVISTLLFGGIPGSLLPLWKNLVIQPLISKEILEEYVRVLTYPKFCLSEEDIHFLLYREILPFFKETVVTRQTRVVPNDPSDDKFIACAKAGKAAFIISGDKHLLDLGRHKSIEIVTPSQMLSKLHQQGKI
ncbi:MAG: putative toxin-antitoxin system toxin component, PIN family [Syntrophaceae bacterium]|nr:putative toxin-antitoxin system toxin component, PIN family [Syntrophaceae bacterium]